MATIRVLRECVVAHRRRIPGELVDMDEHMARRLADESPETFEWVDRPVKQFVDVVPEAPVEEVVVQMPSPRRRRKKAEAGDAEVSDGDESAG